MASEEREVVLHVYDLSKGLAKIMSPPFLGKQIDGIWHTGVVVDGKEYYYGGGIQMERAGQTYHGVPLETVKLGTTSIPEELIVDFLSDISPRFSAATYSLLHNNCNNFSNELSLFLTGSSIPEHITGLPAEFLSTEIGQSMAAMLLPIEQQMKQMSGHSVFPMQAAPAVAPATPAAPSTSDGLATPVAPTKAAQSTTMQAPVAQTPGATGAATPAGIRSEEAAIKKPSTKAQFEALVKEEFTRLVAEGNVSVNEAAAQAVRLATSRAKSTAS
mmetsp:Transcript_36484/g.103047  ORF Transcript_36484/g.103047 Transcript_36484/m.103047 type:complete len:273 (-) Transcript_36484:131-949(-)